MSYTLPHSFMMLPPPSFQEEKGGTNHYESYTKITFYFNFSEMTTVNTKITWIF